MLFDQLLSAPGGCRAHLILDRQRGFLKRKPPPPSTGYEILLAPTTTGSSGEGRMSVAGREQEVAVEVLVTSVGGKGGGWSLRCCLVATRSSC